jgi:hypothetical protein
MAASMGQWLTVTHGEPVYYQELPINLVVVSGKCSIR